MPELPEVETVKNGLLCLEGSQITNITIRFPRLRYPLNQDELGQAIGQKVIRITRRAKYLLFQLERGCLLVHLGMSGRLTLYFKGIPEVKKHDHVDIVLDDYVLRYNDTRRFGCITYVKDTLDNHPLLYKLGPEPLSNNFTPEYFIGKLHNKNTPIKQIIMDNAIVVGVGNIYACESLFLTKISPLRKGKNLSKEECKSLLTNIRHVFLAAIKAGGSSLRDYKNADGELGYFQQSHYVYGRAKKACKICGDIIQDIRLGQRNSFYCPSCQK